MSRPHQRQVRKRLWEVAYLAAQLRVILLREKPQVISYFEQAFEQFLRLLDPANKGVVVGQPKRCKRGRPPPSQGDHRYRAWCHSEAQSHLVGDPSRSPPPCSAPANRCRGGIRRAESSVHWHREPRCRTIA